MDNYVCLQIVYHYIIWIDKFIDEQIDKFIDEQIDEFMDKYTWIDRSKDKQIDRY